MEYEVVWRIEVDADSPREAAEKALEIHRDPESTATVFEVRPFETTTPFESIDLLEEAVTSDG